MTTRFCYHGVSVCFYCAYLLYDRQVFHLGSFTTLSILGLETDYITTV